MVKDVFEKLLGAMASVMVGVEDTTELLLIAMLSGGHVLLEDLPGTGKTVMAATLAKSAGGNFKRVQFTPDLLPSDITGQMVYDGNTFIFRKGPIFTNFLLADELNRATPRTQSALLECMAEYQVSIDGETHKLPVPFFVAATQNPIETQGTFPLPEAQLDRFLMRLSLGYLPSERSIELMERIFSPTQEIQASVSLDDIAEAQKEFMTVHVSRPIREYIVAITEATRKHDDVTAGVSSRGLLALERACRVCALTGGRGFVLPDDVKRLAVPVLAHRLSLKAGWRVRSERSEEVLRDILSKVPAPTERPDLS